MPYLTDVVNRSLTVLASQFGTNLNPQDLTNFQKFIKSFSESVQFLEDVNNQLLTNRNIFTSVGVQLDGIGQILDLDRLDGESDDDYRERLKFQTFINIGNGTPEEMISIIKFLTSANKVRYIEYYPAAFQLMSDGTTFTIPVNDLVTAIQKASPASVQYTPIVLTYGVEVPFVFSPDFVFEPLLVTDPSDPSTLVNLELDTGNDLYVNSSVSGVNPEGGGFSEAIGTYPNYTYDITGAGQFCEVIYFNGNMPI